MLIITAIIILLIIIIYNTRNKNVYIYIHTLLLVNPPLYTISLNNTSIIPIIFHDIPHVPSILSNIHIVFQ